MRRMTLAQARAHFGMADSISDAAVRAAAEADGIKIVTEAPAPGQRRQPATAQSRSPVDDGDGDESDEDADADAGGDEELSSALSELTEVAGRLAASIDASGSRATQEQTHLGVRISEVLREAQQAGLSTPSRREAPRGPSVRIFDRFDQMGYGRSQSEPNPTPERRAELMRANFELAAMIFGGTQSGQVRTASIAMPEDFRRAWQHHVFGDPQRVPWMSDGEGSPTRAMDTAETGFGADLIGAQYVRELWEGARNTDSLVQSIRNIPMTEATTTIPIDGSLPEMLFVGESTGAPSDWSGAPPTSKTGSSKKVLTAKKFTIQEIWSGELNEDSIIAYTPFLREKLMDSTALHLGSAIYNGDTTNAGTGNINSDDADPADTRHYLAFDGIRHYWLVDDSGQAKDMAAALDIDEVIRARGKLSRGGNSVNSLENINFGQDASRLRAVTDWDTYMEMHTFDEVRTVDRYGAMATVVTGELGRVDGIPLVSPGYAVKTEADGKLSATAGNNTKGHLTVFNPAGFIRGTRRDVQLFFDRIQRTDQFLFELYTRVGLQRYGNNVAAGVYDITV